MAGNSFCYSHMHEVRSFAPRISDALTNSKAGHPIIGFNNSMLANFVALPSFLYFFFILLKNLTVHSIKFFFSNEKNIKLIVLNEGQIYLWGTVMCRGQVGLLNYAPRVVGVAQFSRSDLAPAGQNGGARGIAISLSFLFAVTVQQCITQAHKSMNEAKYLHKNTELLPS